ncbi:MAG: DNA-binding response regulator, partial [Anaerolineales bacterium]
LVIADIALLDERPDGDAIGLEIASQIDVSIPTIIWTAYPDVERVQRALTQGDEPNQRRAFAFVSKRESSSNTKLLKAIRRALQTGEHAINLDLQVDCQGGFSFVSLAGRFIPEKENPSVTRVDMAQGELRDVYRKLFLDNKKIYLGQLPHPRPETALTCVWPEGEGVTQVSLVVECGARSVIRSIRYNWEKFIQPYLQGLAVHFERSAETRHFAGIVYRLGEPVETFQSFREFYRSMPVERVIEVIRGFFEVCCARWYQTTPHVFTQSLDQVYLRELGLAGREEELEALLRNRLWRHPLSLNRRPQGPYRLGWTKGKAIELCHPLEVIREPPRWLSLQVEHHSAITHGNLNGDTLLISQQGRFWLLGDPATGYGYILRDLASLEATIMLELTQGVKPEETMLAFRAWLSPQSFEEPFQMAGLADEYRKALTVVGELRKQAASLNSPQIGYYYFALMMHVAALLLQNTRLDNQAWVLAWALLADRVQKFPEWEPALAGGTSSLRLDENRHAVFVPWSGRWEDLTIKEFDLLALLLRYPGVLVTWEQVNEVVWGKGAQVSPDMRDQLVRRLREKVEQDPRQPRYLITRKGIGLVFDPSGGEV